MTKNKHLDYERGLQQGKFEKEMELAPERINLRNENLKLRNNWHELKKWLKETCEWHEKDDKKNNCEWMGYNAYYELLNKMKELEGKQ